jgi:hypothetical protein
LKRKLPFAVTLMLLISFGISALLYLFFDVAQLQFKLEAKEHITSKSGLQTVRLSVNEFNKNKEKDELWLDGKLYDISSYAIISDYVLVTVFHDEREEGLVKSIVDSFEPNDRLANDHTVHLSKHRIHMPESGKVLVARYTIKAALLSGDYLSTLRVSEFIPQLFASVIKPPPKAFLSLLNFLFLIRF